MATALIIIVIILVSSGSRLVIRKKFDVKQHIEQVERAANRNAEVKAHH